MKDLEMDIDWRTVQFFIDEDGVAEVSIAAHDNLKVRCSCPTFSRRAACPHQKFVRNKIIENGSHYTIQIPDTVDDEDAFAAMDDADTFRAFVLKHARVEVLD